MAQSGENKEDLLIRCLNRKDAPFSISSMSEIQISTILHESGLIEGRYISSIKKNKKQGICAMKIDTTSAKARSLANKIRTCGPQNVNLQGCECKLSLSAPAFKYIIKGMPKNESEENILKDLQIRNSEHTICSAKRLGKSTIMMITSNNKERPRQLQTTLGPRDTQEYKTGPVVCYNCLSVSHQATRCNRPPKCAICSGPHNYTKCDKKKAPKCAWCERKHTFFQCTSRKESKKGREDPKQQTNSNSATHTNADKHNTQNKANTQKSPGSEMTTKYSAAVKTAERDNRGTHRAQSKHRRTIVGADTSINSVPEKDKGQTSRHTQTQNMGTQTEQKGTQTPPLDNPKEKDDWPCYEQYIKNIKSELRPMISQMVSYGVLKAVQALYMAIGQNTNKALTEQATTANNSGRSNETPADEETSTDKPATPNHVAEKGEVSPKGEGTNQSDKTCEDLEPAERGEEGKELCESDVTASSDESDSLDQPGKISNCENQDGSYSPIRPTNLGNENMECSGQGEMLNVATAIEHRYELRHHRQRPKK